MNTQKSLTNITFTNVTPVKRPQGTGPLLQWFNALPAGKTNAIGWHIQANRCSDALNEALKALGVERLTVLHRMTGEMVEYWSLNTASLIVLCNGFEDVWAMKQSDERQGLAYGWIDAKNASKLKVRVYVQELADVGYYEPFIVSLEGMITECFLTALEQQFHVLDAFEALSGSQAPFYGFFLTMAPAEKPKMVGAKGKQSPIIPMLAVVPAEIDVAYLEQHVANRDVLDRIEKQDLLSKAIAWSIETSKRINQGEDKESWEQAEYEEALSNAQYPPSSFDEEDPLEPSPQQKERGWNPATKQQLASIAKLCNHLNRPVPARKVGEPLSYDEAGKLIAQLSKEFNSRNARGTSGK